MFRRRKPLWQKPLPNQPTENHCVGPGWLFDSWGEDNKQERGMNGAGILNSKNLTAAALFPVPNIKRSCLLMLLINFVGRALLSPPKICPSMLEAIRWLTVPPSWLVVFPRGGRSAVGSTKNQELVKELQNLQAAEQQLESLIQMCTTQFKLLTEDPENKWYPSFGDDGGLGGSSRSEDTKPVHDSSVGSRTAQVLSSEQVAALLTFHKWVLVF